MRQIIRKLRSLTAQALAGIIVVVGVLVVAGIYTLNRPSPNNAPIEFPHIHGLGFSNDGSRLIVPAHIGLIVFENNAWGLPELPRHDYMGYFAIDAGFYSSGHPDLRTDFPPLLGLVKSEDAGHSIQPLAFGGESDFHLMSASYYSHTVYVINPEPNSGIGVGLFYTTDDGQTWAQSSGQGLGASPIQIVVHPSEPNTVAAATDAGLFLSNDYGDNFIRLGERLPVTAVTFHLDGKSLFFGYQNLYANSLVTGGTEVLNAPPATSQNGLNYIAVNPVSGELAIATASRDIYLSRDNRQTWQQIAAQGRG